MTAILPNPEPAGPLAAYRGLGDAVLSERIEALEDEAPPPLATIWAFLPNCAALSSKALPRKSSN